MRNLTPSELFSRGYKAKEIKDYSNAEEYFLASLLEYSKAKNDTVSLYASSNSLSLLYSQGHFNNQIRALNYFELFSKVNTDASLGFAHALINGIFGEPNYKEALKQLSKVSLESQIYIIAYLLHNGFGIEKNNQKAAILLSSPDLQYTNQSKNAQKLYDTIGINVELDENDLRKETQKILNEVFDDNTLEFDKYPNNLDSVVTAFFENQNNIPDIDISTNEQQTKVKQETDNEYQVRNIRNIFNSASMSPVFKRNENYCIGNFANMTPYIAYNDVHNDKYIIRARPFSENNSFDSEEREIIKEYSSIESLVHDGWRLD